MNMYNKQLPKITIITATYNASSSISNTIESILKQTYKNVEYIIVDGKSTDNTIDIIKKYEPLFLGRLKWLSEKDAGIYDAWNKAINISTGEWIGFVGGDDTLYPTALEEYVKNINGSTSPINYISSKIELIGNQSITLRTIGECWSKKMLIHNVIAHVGSLHHRSLFDKFGLYSLKYNICSDYDFLLKCYDNIVPGYFCSITARMSTGGISNSAGYQTLKETRDIKLFYKKREAILCYFDFYISIIKYIFRRFFKGY